MYIIFFDDLKGFMKGECVMFYGGNKFYNLWVLMIIFDKEVVEWFGLFRVNCFWFGGFMIDGVCWCFVGFFDNVDCYLFMFVVKKWQIKVDDEDVEELECDKVKVEVKQK